MGNQRKQKKIKKKARPIALKTYIAYRAQIAFELGDLPWSAAIENLLLDYETGKYRPDLKAKR